jgi:hypothetical protein
MSALARRLGAAADGSTLLQAERYDWSHIPNLDAFFARLYVYFTDKGFVMTLVRCRQGTLPPGVASAAAPRRARSYGSRRRSAAS